MNVVALTKKINKGSMSKYNNLNFNMVCRVEYEKHTAKMGCAVQETSGARQRIYVLCAFFYTHGIAFPANLFIAREIYLDISREILGSAVKLRILVN